VERKKNGTTAQEINVLALRRRLNRSIQCLRTLQATYTPIAIVALGLRMGVPEDEQPENVPLFLVLDSPCRGVSFPLWFDPAEVAGLCNPLYPLFATLAKICRSFDGRECSRRYGGRGGFL
jgi:hypothetical protein